MNTQGQPSLNRLSECPKEFEDRLFPLLFEASAYANMNVKQQQEVTQIMRTELDRIAENEYARKEGLKQGREEGREEGYKKGEAAGIEKGKEELAKQLLSMGIPVETIQQASGFTQEQIAAL